jgi:hypothetical protein
MIPMINILHLVSLFLIFGINFSHEFVEGCGDGTIRIFNVFTGK